MEQNMRTQSKSLFVAAGSSSDSFSFLS